jgi:serpin B
MVIVLPKSEHDLNEVLPSIQWDSIPFERMTGSIYMPTFKANGGYDLERLLKDYLGIRTIFETYPNAVLEENIFISQVRQDYFINVNEEGTEAAAVTSIVASQWGGSGRSFNMYCNRPFAFAIRENKTGLILFMGEYKSVPKAEN